jgi:hypothetical protein
MLHFSATSAELLPRQADSFPLQLLPSSSTPPPLLQSSNSMAPVEDTCASLRAQISATEAHLAGLKRDLAEAEKVAHSARPTNDYENAPNCTDTETGTGRWPLLKEEYKRYGRQMIVSQLGLEGEKRRRANGF